jgi:ribosome modulation factor
MGEVGPVPRYRVEQAWIQGFEAGARLLPSTSNPYKVGADLHEAWFDGWCSGSEPDLE